MMKNRHCKRGSSLPETALIMVVLLMLTFGIMDFGRALYTYAFLTNVAQKAVRWASVRGSNCTLLNDCGGGNTYVTQYIVGQDLGIVNPSLMNISGDYGNGNAPGNLVVVYILYPFNFMMPWMPNTTINFRVAARMHIVN